MPAENKKRKTREELEVEKALLAVAKQVAEEKATQSAVPASSVQVFIVITFPFPYYLRLASCHYLHAGDRHCSGNSWRQEDEGEGHDGT